MTTTIATVSESENRPPASQHDEAQTHILPYALYCSSIIIGAGILTLPIVVAQIGLVPAVVLTLLLGILFAAIYVRIARSVRDYVVRVQVGDSCEQAAPVHQELGVGPALSSDFADFVLLEEAERKGIGLLDEVCAWLGFGRAGRMAIVVGLLAYVLPACIGYVTIGGTTLGEIASLALGQRLSAVWPAALAVVTMLASFLITRLLPFFALRATIAKVLQMSASWTVGVFFLMTAPLPLWVAITLFATGTLGVIWRPSGANIETASGELLAEHRVGTIIAVVELALLAATAVFAVVILAQHQGQLVIPPMALLDIAPSQAAKALGVLLFAYVGTGIFNLIRYPRLFKGGRQRPPIERVVGLGTVIPIVTYLGWMVAVAFCVSAAALQAADRTRSYPTIPLAQTIARLGGAGWIVIAAGLFVALLAVTGACMGFSESLADRIARVWKRAFQQVPTTQAPTNRATRIAQAGVFGCATAAAIALAALPSTLQFSSMLAVAGAIGGGMLFLVLPFFIPTRGRLHGHKWEIALATVMAIGLVVITWIASPPDLGHDPVNTATGLVILAIIIMFLVAVIALIIGEPRESAPTDRSR